MGIKEPYRTGTDPRCLRMHDLEQEVTQPLDQPKRRVAMPPRQLVESIAHDVGSPAARRVRTG